MQDGCAEQSGACVAAISLARLKSFWLGRYGVLQVDGEMEGDVRRAEVIAGQGGRGGKAVALQASSHVQDEVHHMSLAIEQGAMFEGRAAVPPTRQRSIQSLTGLAPVN